MDINILVYYCSNTPLKREGCLIVYNLTLLKICELKIDRITNKMR